MEIANFTRDYNNPCNMISPRIITELKCPNCKTAVIPRAMRAININGKTRHIAEMPCCGKTFLLDHIQVLTCNSLIESYDSGIDSKSFSTIINEISPEFQGIYNEANLAHRFNLLNVCGGGYRKALEFMVYDYVIKKNPDKREQILNMEALANVIKTYLNDDLLKIHISAASWLGNDALHYKRKYEELDIQDLVSFIDDVIDLIELKEKMEGKIKMMPKLEEKVLEMNKKTKNQP